MEIKIKGVYPHYRGNFYIVEDVGIDSSTLEKQVIYRALYGDNKLWIRSLSDFCAEVNQNDQKYRFELQEIASKDSKYV